MVSRHIDSQIFVEHNESIFTLDMKNKHISAPVMCRSHLT